MVRQILDANVLIRFLRGDHPEHSPKTRVLIAQAEAGEIRLVLFASVVAEVVFVLTSVYGCSRREVAESLLPFLHHGGIDCPEADSVSDALRRFQSKRVDYMDCYLAAEAKLRGVPVVSFDRDFRKFDDIDWCQPGD